MIVTFYRIPKKPNSTKSYDEALQHSVTVNVDIKEPCALSAPVFTLHTMPGGDMGGPSCWPVDVISEAHPDLDFPSNLRRYTHVEMTALNPECPVYRIVDIEIENTVSTFYLEPDLLASYREKILASNQFVSRSDNAARKTRNITDTTAVAKNMYTFNCTNSKDVFTSGYDNGSYVLGVINSTPTHGGICYYLLPSKYTFEEICRYLTDDTFFDGVTDISTELMKHLINPFQYIVSCRYFPLNIDYYEINGEPVYETVRIGSWDLPVKAFRLFTDETTIFGVLPISQHPQAEGDGNSYLMLSPYTNHTFYLEPFGAIPVDSTYLAGSGNRLCFKVVVDHISGKGMLYLFRESSTEDYIGVYYADVAQDMPIHQITQDIPAAIESAFAAPGRIGRSVLSLDFAGAIGNATSNIFDSFEAAMGQVRSSTGSTFVPFVGGPAKLYTKHTHINIEHNQEFGYAVQGHWVLAQCYGEWVQCPKPELELVCTEANALKIYEFMKNGIYIE